MPSIRASSPLSLERFTVWRLRFTPVNVKPWESSSKAGGLPSINYAKALIPKVEPGGCITAHNVEEPRSGYRGRYRLSGTDEYYQYMKNLKLILNILTALFVFSFASAETLEQKILSKDQNSRASGLKELEKAGPKEKETLAALKASKSNIKTDFKWVDEKKKEEYYKNTNIVVLPQQRTTGASS